MISERCFFYIRAAFLFFLLCMFSDAGCIMAKDCVCGTRRVAAADQKAITQLNLARQYREAGNMTDANMLYSQVAATHKGQYRPSWLDATPSQLREPPPMPLDERLARISLLPYELASILLEDLLQREPGNLKVRQLYLNLATANGDKPQITRHRSILASCSQNGWQPCIWYAAGIILLGIIIFQLYSLSKRLAA